MNEKKHLDFIQNLSKELTAVDVYWSAEKRTAFWLFVHALWMFPVMWLVQPFGHSFHMEALHFPFIFEVTLFVVALILSGYFSFLSLVPGALQTRKFKLALIPLILLSLFIFFEIFNPAVPVSKVGQRSFCEFEILFYSLIPLSHTFYLMKKGLFFEKSWTTVCAGLSSALLPAMIMHFACAYDHKHILIFHIVPIFFVTLVVAPLLKKIIKK